MPLLDGRGRTRSGIDGGMFKDPHRRRVKKSLEEGLRVFLFLPLPYFGWILYPFFRVELGDPMDRIRTKTSFRVGFAG